MPVTTLVFPQQQAKLDILLQHLPSSAIIDTGSAISVIPSNLVHHLRLTPTPTSPITMYSASGHHVPSNTSVTILTTAADRSFSIPITYYVAPSNMPLIIGMDTLRHGILSIRHGNLSLSFSSPPTSTPIPAMVQTIDLDISESIPGPIDDFRSFMDSQKVPFEQLIDSSLSSTQQSSVLWTLQRHLKSFAADPKKPSTTSVFHPIDTGTASPLKQRPYRVPPSTATLIEEEVKNMLQNGIIRPSNSPWSSPVILVTKKDGSIRFCIDYRRLNQITTADAFPMPIAEDLFDRIGRSSYFSSLDLASGYWQVPMNENDIPKTAFATPNGLYEFLVMPFGLCNAPQTFQRLMHSVLHGLEAFTAVYLDDIIIFSRSFQEHLEHTRIVLKRIQDWGLSLKLSKCRFASTSAVFLGHKIENGKLLPLRDKVDKVLQVPAPKNVDELRSFLGLASYYRKFIRDFSKRAEPLNQLLKTNTPYLWNDAAQKAFDDLKTSLNSAPVLTQPDFEKPFQLCTDASNTALGAVLEQDGHPICYASRSLAQNERNYSTTERECLAVIWAIKKFRHYLLGRKFTVFTDHHALQWLLSTSNLSGRLVRWSLALQEHNLEIKHRPGVANINADALSRIPIAAITLDNLSTTQKLDPFCTEIIGKLDASTSSYSSGDSVFILTNGILYRHSKSLSKKGTRVKDNPMQLVLPTTMIQEVLKDNHDKMGHLGTAKTIFRLQQHYYWPNLSSAVEKYIKECDTCASMKNYGRATRAELHPMPTTFPMEQVTMDIIGPLPTTPSGHTYIICFVDSFTKWPEAYPLADITADSVAKVFVDNFVFRHGCPKRILSDRGSNFTSELMLRIHSLLGIKPVFTSSYHPQTDGLTERFNRTLQDMIATSNLASSWDTALPALLFAYRTSIHPSSKETPYFLMHGRDARLPHSLDLDANDVHFDQLSDYTQHLVQTLLKTFPAVRTSLQLSAASQKHYYDQNATDVPNYKVGDRVWLFATTRTKFEPRWLGPYLITDVLSPVTLRLALPDYARLHNTVHVNRVKPYNGTKPVDVPSEPSTIEPSEVNEPPAVLEQEYDVERILRHEIDPLTNAPRFRIRWKNFSASSDTWEPADHLPSSLIANYFTSNSRTSSSRRGGNVRKQ